MQNSGDLSEVPARPITADLAVIILTRNEEKNLAQALRSVVGWAREVVVLDSLSTDRTEEVARSFPDVGFFQNRFVSYPAQRNHALERLPLASEWIMFLDADEWVTAELRHELALRLRPQTAENGFYVKRRLVWMGRWIRRGRYPLYILRVFRRGRGRCEDRPINEHLLVDGPIGVLDHDIVDENHNGVMEWMIKHQRYADLEARELLRQTTEAGNLRINLWGSQAERTRWLRQRVWNRLPPLLRPFLYFLYRYFLRGGFLDGRAALVYHFLQAWWYPLIIDVRYLELKAAHQRGEDKA